MKIKKEIIPFSPNMMFPIYIIGLSDEKYLNYIKEKMNNKYGMFGGKNENKNN